MKGVNLMVVVVAADWLYQAVVWNGNAAYEDRWKKDGTRNEGIRNTGLKSQKIERKIWAVEGVCSVGIKWTED